MRSLKKLFLCILTLQIIGSSYISSKSINLSLNRIKKKIENAVKNSAKKTKDSIKNIIQQETSNLDAKEADKLALAKAISIVDSGYVKGLDLLSYPTKKFLENFQNLSSNNKLLCNQTEFIKNLKSSFDSNDINKARKILHQKIVELYPNEKSPFLKFVSNLGEQETELTNIIKELQNLLEKKQEIKNKNQSKKLKQAAIKLDKIKTDFETLYDITNKILVGF